MNENSLELIKLELDNEGIDTLIQKNEETSQQEQLLIFLGADSENRNLIATLMIEPLDLETDLSIGKKEVGRRFIKMKIDAIFPFKVKDLALIEVAQYLHFLNGQIEIPGFYLNYLDNSLLYRFVQMVDRESISLKVILCVLGNIMLFQETMGPSLERLANGEISCIDLMDEIQKMMKPSNDLN